MADGQEMLCQRLKRLETTPLHPHTWVATRKECRQPSPARPASFLPQHELAPPTHAHLKQAGERGAVGLGQVAHRRKF